MGEIIFKTELIKGAKGDRGEAGQADSIPTDGVIAFQGETVPDGYEETDPGDVFDEVYEDINAVKDMISDEYDTTATYNAGDYCTHENALYKCTATTTGPWDSSKWVLTSASDETKANTSAIEELTERANGYGVSVTAASGYTITDNYLKVVNGVLVGHLSLLGTSSLPTMQWETVATTTLRPSNTISVPLYSQADGVSGGLMQISASGYINVFQAYYDPNGTVSKRGCSGSFSNPI